MDIPRYERLWLGIGIGTLILFLLITGYMGFSMGLHPTDGMERTVEPEKVTRTPPFDNPGLERIGPNEYVLTSVSFVFGYDPKEVTVPAGAKVHFRVTSRDVIHGFYIPGTTVNMMVEPGHITEQTYTFDKPGKYLVLCHEYCGSGHHLMQGTIYVKGE
jgi:cytochrome c oxidase subunit 2